MPFFILWMVMISVVVIVNLSRINNLQQNQHYPTKQDLKEMNRYEGTD